MMDAEKRRNLVAKAENKVIDLLCTIESTNPAKASEILDTHIGNGSAKDIIAIRKAAEAYLAA